MENYIKRFIDVMLVEKNLSAKTVESYSADLRQFIKFNTGKSIICVSEIDLHNYIKSIFERGYSDSTVLRKISALSSFYAFLVRECVIETSPAIGLTMFRKKKPLPKVLSEEEIIRLINAARGMKNDNGRALAIISMMYSSGVRVSELLDIKLSSIKEMLSAQQGGDSMYLVVRGKGRKERAVVFNSLAIDAMCNFLHESKNNSKWLFPGNNSKYSLTRQRVVQIFKELSTIAGIDSRRISPHVIRHSFATHMLNKNADMVFIQKQLGHANIATTETYTHVAKGRLFNIIKERHPLGQKNLFDGEV